VHQNDAQSAVLTLAYIVVRLTQRSLLTASYFIC